MPNIKSAKKRVKVIATKTARNKATKSALRTAVKKAYYAVDTNADNKTEAVRLAIKKIKSYNLQNSYDSISQLLCLHHFRFSKNPYLPMAITTKKSPLFPIFIA